MVTAAICTARVEGSMLSQSRRNRGSASDGKSRMNGERDGALIGRSRATSSGMLSSVSGWVDSPTNDSMPFTRVRLMGVRPHPNPIPLGEGAGRGHPEPEHHTLSSLAPEEERSHAHQGTERADE